MRVNDDLEAATGHQSGPPRGRKGWILGGVAVLIVAAVVYAIVAVATRENPFEVASAACELQDNPNVRLIDGGATLILDPPSAEDPAGPSAIELACVLGELDVPSSVLVRMESERDLPTRPAAEWDGMSIEWSYHPDSSMTVIFRR